MRTLLFPRTSAVPCAFSCCCLCSGSFWNIWKSHWRDVLVLKSTCFSYRGPWFCVLQRPLTPKAPQANMSPGHPTTTPTPHPRLRIKSCSTQSRSGRGTHALVVVNSMSYQENSTWLHSSLLPPFPLLSLVPGLGRGRIMPYLVLGAQLWPLCSFCVIVITPGINQH